jgi:hypothetical protein
MAPGTSPITRAHDECRSACTLNPCLYRRQHQPDRLLPPRRGHRELGRPLDWRRHRHRAIGECPERVCVGCSTTARMATRSILTRRIHRPQRGRVDRTCGSSADRIDKTRKHPIKGKRHCRYDRVRRPLDNDIPDYLPQLVEAGKIRRWWIH